MSLHADSRSPKEMTAEEDTAGLCSLLTEPLSPIGILTYVR
jgi:hypothetical protein